jgi:hypothetical protein
MSLEYAIEYPCEMRRRRSEPELRALGRTGALVARIVAQTLASEQAPLPESVQFTAGLARELERVEEVAAYCRTHCPVHSAMQHENEAGESIGCLGRIRYPIDARFEHFLADRVQLLCDTVAPAAWPRLLQVLLDVQSPFDGEATKELRRVTTAEGLRFFELRLPIVLARQAARITTDNVFDLLAGFAASDEGAAGYQRELPVVALSDYAEFLGALLLDDLSPDERARLSAQSTAYAQYVRFTEALQVAEDAGVRLLLD